MYTTDCKAWTEVFWLFNDPKRGFGSGGLRTTGQGVRIEEAACRSSQAAEWNCGERINGRD